MKVKEIDNIERIPLAIDYRRMYRARVTIAIGEAESSPCPVEFALELSPFGSQQVSVTFLGNTDYPLIPAVRLLKQHLVDLDRAGGLP
ncbi:hypothetical protein SAMN05920897_11756 [Alkalispirochaeta americana]|uniref:Uncharacterized protein n=1 Tax=Alkalispirochaeta americana TaxID=159291 RepID=A0A1N6WGD5_9SPIO|nr:hypothetical protein [Alkalispirochaeta americana]SIQ89040.1 hypothetical protein SAMN05920897_11756 [Alkalispirochaeta americana]